MKIFWLQTCAGRTLLALYFGGSSGRLSVRGLLCISDYNVVSAEDHSISADNLLWACLPHFSFLASFLFWSNLLGFFGFWVFFKSVPVQWSN